MTHAPTLGIAPIQASVSDAEWQARVDLAACYRLCDRYGMSDMIYTHITARVPDAPGQFLINPNGIAVGQGAQIDTGGFLASTLQMNDADFLAGKFRLSAGTDAQNGKLMPNRLDVPSARPCPARFPHRVARSAA